jgi:NADH-quinone oxidoreductase subunit N
MAAASVEQYLLVFIALLNTVISLYYYLLIVKAMYIREAIPDAPAKFNTDIYNRISLLFCVFGILALGIFGFFIYNMADKFSFGI